MSFTSPLFLVFLAAVLLGVRLLPSGRRWLLLLPASWLFYACHNVWLLGLLLLATGASYGCALRMGAAGERRVRRFWLLLGCGVLLGMLFVFKYLDLAAGGVAALLRLAGRDTGFTGFHLLLPMGISFYVFQTLSYLIDVYRGRVQPERHWGHYALFVSFFPQLVAGPIERPGDLLPQLRAPQSPDEQQVRQGLLELVRGYAKKVMIADCLAGYVDAAYAAPEQAGGAALMLATALFAIQIYCDFSGYTDIAMGCARLLGVRLSANFRKPYAAVTVRDFWRRWHISLTQWFTDYVYIPLGGRRKGTARHCINILAVFLCSGLWHGADITFVIWGGLHGVYLVAETLLDSRQAPKHPRLRHALTLLLVGFAWIFFRAGSLDHAMTVLRVMATDLRPAALLTGLGLPLADCLPVAGLLLAAPLLERLPALDERRGTTVVYLLLITVLVLCRCMVLAQGGAAAFIYFQF